MKEEQPINLDQIEIPIIYRDEDLIVVHKPSGIVVHPDDRNRLERVSLMVLIRRICRRRVFPIHRLDRPTSGLIVFALSRAAASELNRQFREHLVTKKYLALVRGVATDQTIDYPLKERPLYRTDMVRAEPQEAVTLIRVIDSIELDHPVGRYATCRYSLIEATPVTGRRHQIRRHLKHIFHPIIGDTTYGDGKHNRFFRDRFDNNRLLLAATRLTLHHPVSGEVLDFSVAPSTEMKQILEDLGFRRNGNSW